MAAALDSKPSAFGREGSTPSHGTVGLYSPASRFPMGLNSFLVKRGMVHLNT